MKKTIYTIAFLVSLLWLNSGAYSQTYGYSYDAAGNRMARNILVLKAAKVDRTNNVAFDNTKIDGKSKGTDMLGDVTLNINPNPTAGLVEIDIINLSNESTGEILVFDIKGTLLFRQERITLKSEINLLDHPQGTYIIKIFVDDEVSEWKIIKE